MDAKTTRIPRSLKVARLLVVVAVVLGVVALIAAATPLAGVEYVWLALLTAAAITCTGLLGVVVFRRVRRRVRIAALLSCRLDPRRRQGLTAAHFALG